MQRGNRCMDIVQRKWLARIVRYNFPSRGLTAGSIRKMMEKISCTVNANRQWQIQQRMGFGWKNPQTGGSNRGMKDLLCSKLFHCVSDQNFRCFHTKEKMFTQKMEQNWNHVIENGTELKPGDRRWTRIETTWSKMEHNWNHVIKNNGNVEHFWLFFLRGTSGIDIDLRRVDIDQCPVKPGSTDKNVFAGSAKCKPTTQVMCDEIESVVPHEKVNNRVLISRLVQRRVTEIH